MMRDTRLAVAEYGTTSKSEPFWTDTTSNNSAKRKTGWPRERVLGQAGVLDASRMAAFIALETGFSTRDITTIVLGGHGDTMVPLVRYASVQGIPVMELLEQKYGNAAKAEEVMTAMVERTKAAGGEVVALLKTGSAFYSPASAAIAMAESVLKDQKRVLPTCALLNGEFGVDGYYVGVPCVLGAGGVEKVVEFELDATEQARPAGSAVARFASAPWAPTPSACAALEE